MKKWTGWISIFMIGTVAASLLGQGWQEPVPGPEAFQKYGEAFLQQQLTGEGEAMKVFTEGEWQTLISSLELTEYNQEEVGQLYPQFQQLWQTAEYEILDGEVTEDGYCLTVRIYPVDSLVRIRQLYNDYGEDFANRNSQEEFSHLTDEEYKQTYLAGILDLVLAAFQTSEALPAVEYQLRLQPDEKGEYEVRQEDFITIRNGLLPLE